MPGMLLFQEIYGVEELIKHDKLVGADIVTRLFPSLFQDYFDDILRLHYLHNDGMKALFIVCGGTLNFNSQFRSTKNRTTQLSNKKGLPSGLFSQCLSFSVRRPTKSFSTNKYQQYYTEFCNNYNFKQPQLTHPTTINIQTRLVKIINDFDQQSVGIWEVL